MNNIENMGLQSINPATGETVHTYTELSDHDIEQKVQTAERAYGEWKKTSYAHRADLLKKAAAHLRAQKTEYAKIMAVEMGKPVTQGEGEVEKCASVCDYYADNGAEFLKDKTYETDASHSYVRYAPLGVVLAVMPWNFPFWQVFRFAAPALMVGNVGVLKHASNVQGCSVAIEEVFRAVGFPEGVFQSLLIGSSKVEALIEHSLVKAVSLTGSNSAGEKVGGAAGKNIKKAVLELGGSDPFIVLDGVDMETCATTAVQARLVNGGQSCIAAKRFIVLDHLADEFEKIYAEKMAAMIVGDPLDPQTQVGPMAREDLLIELDKQVQASIQKGATVALGGHRLDRSGAFYAPTLLTQVTKGMPVYDEETFGPVAAVIRVASVEEAIRVANDTVYGLGASVWSGDKDLALEVALQIEAGAVFVNGIVKSDPRMPFGGVKKSGYGRELSEAGIHEFVNVQTVWIKA